MSTEEEQPALLQISNEIVQLYKKQLGRGPTKARTDWLGADALVCTLEDSITAAERSLLSLGERNRMRDVRLLFQDASEVAFTNVVERHTGRKVRGFISGMDTGKDIAAELFYFEPVVVTD